MRKNIKTANGNVHQILPKKKNVKSYGELGNYQKLRLEEKKEKPDENNTGGYGYVDENNAPLETPDEAIEAKIQAEIKQQQEENDKQATAEAIAEAEATQGDKAGDSQQDAQSGNSSGNSQDMQQLIDDKKQMNAQAITEIIEMMVKGSSQAKGQFGGAQGSATQGGGDGAQGQGQGGGGGGKQEEKKHWTEMLDLHRRIHTLAAVFGAYTQGNIAEKDIEPMYTFKVVLPKDPTQQRIDVVKVKYSEMSSFASMGLPCFIEKDKAEAFAEHGFALMTGYAISLNVAHQNLIKEASEHYKVIHITE